MSSRGKKFQRRTVANRRANLPIVRESDKATSSVNSRMIIRKARASKLLALTNSFSTKETADEDVLNIEFPIIQIDSDASESDEHVDINVDAPKGIVNIFDDSEEDGTCDFPNLGTIAQSESICIVNNKKDDRNLCNDECDNTHHYGPPGPPGKQGKQGKPGCRGPRGKPGCNGKNGKHGKDGCDGQDGKSYEFLVQIVDKSGVHEVKNDVHQVTFGAVKHVTLVLQPLHKLETTDCGLVKLDYLTVYASAGIHTLKPRKGDTINGEKELCFEIQDCEVGNIELIQNGNHSWRAVF